MRYAVECMEISEGSDLPPFYQGYANEAVARAALRLGDAEGGRKFLEAAQGLAGRVEDAESRDMLLSDLGELGGIPSP